MSDATALDDLPQPERETTVHPDELEADGNNPNEIDGDTFELLVEKIQQRGWIGNAIITDTAGVISDGEHRWRAAQEIGLDEVPVKQYDLTDAERRLIRQELNKIRGTHDHEKDISEFKSILSDGRSDELESVLDAVEPSPVDEIFEELSAEQDSNAPLDSVEFDEFDESDADGYEPPSDSSEGEASDGEASDGTEYDPDAEQIVCPACDHEFYPEA